MTLVGKAKLDHPALGTAGGSVLHASIENLWANVSDHLPARWKLFESVANGATVTFEHGFEVPFGDLRVHVYTKGESSNSKVSDLGAAGWSVVATSGFAQTKLDVTAPSSGGPFDFYLYVSHEPMADKLDLSGGTMTGSLVLSGDPSQDLHAATKRYVDLLVQGLKFKEPVKVATTANIGLSGTMTIDGVAVEAGDRVLVKNQTTATQNGIYVVGAGAWSRAADMDAWSEVPSAFVFATQGTDNGDRGFVCTADQGGTIGTTALNWTLIAGIGTVTSGSGGVSVSANAVSLSLSGSTLDQTSGLKVADGGITNTQISASADIADSKLAKISTAGKVSGSAITDGTIGGTTAIATTGTPSFNATDYLKLPAGTDVQRPAFPANGMIRFNSTSLAYEGYNDGEWKSLGGGGTVSKVWSFTPSGTVYGNIARVDGLSLTKADATSSNNAEVLGIVTKVYGGSYERDITLAGSVANLVAANFSENALPARGDVVFLSTTPGLMSVSEPTTIGQVSVPLGVVTWSDPTAGVCTVSFAPKRGVVVGGDNARTQVSLPNNTTQDVQNVSSYEAGELAGWISITAGTSYRFYVQAQFVKGADSNYDISYQVSGDTPPAGFSMSITNGGIIRVTLPNLASYGSAFINYALNAPAVGANFPLTVDGSAVTAATASAPGVVSLSNQSLGAGDKYFSGNVGINNTAPTSRLTIGSGTFTSAAAQTTGLYTNGSNGLVVLTDAMTINSRTGTNYANIDSSGNLLVGATSPIDAVKRIHAENSSPDGQYSARSTTTAAGKYWKFGATANAFQVYNQIGVGQYMVDGQTVWTAQSDERSKKNIKPLQLGLAQIEALKPSSFDYKTDESEDSKRIGFIAQEVLPVIPQAVYSPENPDEMMGVAVTEMIPVMVKAIQELKAELDAVKSELNALKK